MISKFYQTKRIASSIFAFCLVIFLFVLLLINSARYSKLIFEGLLLWLKIIVPSMLPFFVLTTIFKELSLTGKLCQICSPLTKKLYNCDGSSAYVFLMSALSGYPVGARLIEDLYKNGVINTKEACRMFSFTSIGSPVFIIASVGIGIFSDVTIGLLVYLSHLLGAVVNGLLYRGRTKNSSATILAHKRQNNLASVFCDSVYDGTLSMLVIGGFISLFFLLAGIIEDLRLFMPIETLISFLPNGLPSAISGAFLEITRGVTLLNEVNTDTLTRLIFLSGAMSFGGLCVIVQSFSFMNTCKVKSSFLLLSKATHAIISIIIVVILFFITN